MIGPSKSVLVTVAVLALPTVFSSPIPEAINERDVANTASTLEARQVRIVKDNWSTLAQAGLNLAKTHHKSNEAQIHQQNRIPIAARLPSYASQHAPTRPASYPPKLSKFQKRLSDIDEREDSSNLEARQVRIVKDNWSTLAQAGLNLAKTHHKSNEAQIHQQSRIPIAARLPPHASQRAPSRPASYPPKLSKFQKREFDINEREEPSKLEARQVRIVKDNWSTLAQAGLNQAKTNHKSNEAQIHQQSRIPLAARLPSYASQHAPSRRPASYPPKLSKFQKRHSDIDEREESSNLESRQVRIVKDNWSTLAQAGLNQATTNHKSNEAHIHQQSRIPAAARLPSYASQHTPARPASYPPRLSKFQKREMEIDEMD